MSLRYLPLYVPVVIGDINTAEKRRAVSGIWLPLIPGVTPNASKNAEWRQQSAWSYSGIAPDTPPAVGGPRAGSLGLTGVGI